MSRDRARVDPARAATETREDAARVVAALLASASRRRRGASVKARTLARDVRWKRATHAVLFWPERQRRACCTCSARRPYASVTRR